MKKTISIILVTYNSSRYLPTCLDTLSKAKTADDELIIIDGGSNDSTTSIIRNNESLIDKWVSEPDHGIYDAMNKGIKLATGSFLYFIGCDDLLLVRLDTVHPLLKDPRTIYYGNIILGETDIVYDGIFTKRKLAKYNIGHQAIFYPKSVFEKHLYNQRYKYLADYELNIRLMGDPNFLFEHINVNIARYSLKGTSSTSVDVKFKQESYWIIYKNLGLKFVLIKISNIITKLLWRQ